jgi:hypothetical protein
MELYTIVIDDQIVWNVSLHGRAYSKQWADFADGDFSQYILYLMFYRLPKLQFGHELYRCHIFYENGTVATFINLLCWSTRVDSEVKHVYSKL